MKELGRRSRHNEVGGMFVGSVCWDGEPFVLIEDSIEGKYTNNRNTSVTFTSKTWNYVHEQIEQKYSGLVIVGWNHTHPGFGIFLSGYDLFICRETFYQPFHVAYVFDPHIENKPASEGFFVWRDSKIVSQTPLVIENVSKRKYSVKPDVWKTNWSSGDLTKVDMEKNNDMPEQKISITFDDDKSAQPLPPQQPPKEESGIELPLIGRIDIYALVFFNCILSVYLVIMILLLHFLKPWENTMLTIIEHQKKTIGNMQKEIEKINNKLDNLTISKVTQENPKIQTDTFSNQVTKQPEKSIESNSIPNNNPKNSVSNDTNHNQ
ncbi:MAG: hypothetical protein LBG58_07600 [Planctomycetaceae bacterium]|jgi:proteasome lid subunit RPN8/RPN11|nr:hypothetical protein [Planctomycetaceae bacterium]